MKRITALAGAVVLALAVAACGGSHPSQAACKKAMRQQFATAIASGQQGREPAECKGLPDAVLQKLAGQVLSGQ